METNNGIPLLALDIGTTCPNWYEVDPNDSSQCVSSSTSLGGNSSNSSSTTTNTTTVRNDYGNLGIDCSQDSLTNGNCSFNFEKVIGIRPQDQSTSVGTFVTDIVLSATFFIGTVVTVALIYSWLLYVFAGNDEKLANKGKQGAIAAITGLIIVAFSYVIIRVVQYIAKG